MINKTKPEVHPKGWGEELWLVNRPDYCMKLLRFRQDSKCSMHFHIKKHETWYVVKGWLRLHWIDVTDGSSHVSSFVDGDAIEIPPGVPHQVFAITDVEIVEASTHHDEADSYRIAPGDSQKQST